MAHSEFKLFSIQVSTDVYILTAIDQAVNFETFAGFFDIVLWFCHFFTKMQQIENLFFLSILLYLQKYWSYRGLQYLISKLLINYFDL